MAENEASSSASLSRAPMRPTITLPPRASVENLFMGGPGGISPGPMTLVSSFFSDPASEYPSFSQLLAGAMASPADFSGQRQGFPPPPETTVSISKGKESGSGDMDFGFKQNRPSGLVITQSPMFTIPPGLSPAGLLGSPLLFSPGQGPFGMSHQQVLAQVTAQAAHPQSQMHIQPDYPSSSAAPAPSFSQFQSLTSNATANQQILPPASDPNVMKEASEVSLSDQRSEPVSSAVDKPADDGYNWRKYGQKHVKGSEYPRSYYKCTHPNCPVKKKVERSLDGQVTEIIYKGQHNHQPPQSSKRSKESGNPNGNYNLQGPSELSSEGVAGTLNNSKDSMPSYSLRMKDQESSQATHDQVSGSSEGEEVGDAETIADGNDERESKRRAIEVQTSEAASSASHRTVAEPRIIVQTTSEVDLLDDGYRWRKYGQKVVKGNPYPRSYYKCTSQGCNVRKHVERAPSDPKAVITTYEGKHNHDVPAARNSSHNTANNSVSQMRPHNPVVDKQDATRRTGFSNNEQQPIELLRFKEEQVT
ncbi:PREDICTED: probable WRKY transcription factor 4 [Nicotiana attenuata]|uniref:Wrky transcription factor 4 n=1 Tax=Nicotiana attenuata TaxID=49451 RepID=A0A314L972_NICAT|nr:PREDICTED: probable WRKY transcription factor 4 [Nicotiana attenuata]OIT37599.1 putative wrky transcription factor 4 [Nicotiana attenuata]